MAGRPPKPTGQLKAQGTYRKDRHADRGDVGMDLGSPVPPPNLGGESLALWQHVTEAVAAGVIGKPDSTALAGLCRWHSAYLVSMNEGEFGAADRAWRNVVKLLVEFGLTPAARARIKAPVPKKETNPLKARIAGKVG